MPAKVLIAIPTYSGQIEADCVGAILRSTREHHYIYAFASTSLLTRCFNELWCHGLNLQDKIDYFFMLHSDIQIESLWLDKMIRLMEEKQADVLSAVVPIKTPQGLTSTAIDEPVEGGIDPHWRVRRLTMTEVHEMEPTFTHPRLLVNTGCMGVRFKQPWVKEVHFRFEDSILFRNGKYVPCNFPEDWNFSRDVRRKGVSLWATREVKINHMGRHAYPNTVPWGTHKTDALDGEK